jgi:hypothetical protein
MAPFLPLLCCRHQLFACVTAGQCPRSSIDIGQGHGEKGGKNFPSTLLPFSFRSAVAQVLMETHVALVHFLFLPVSSHQCRVTPAFTKK